MTVPPFFVYCDQEPGLSGIAAVINRSSDPGVKNLQRIRSNRKTKKDYLSTVAARLQHQGIRWFALQRTHGLG